MAKRKAASPARSSSGSENITIAPQRRVRQKLAQKALPIRSSSSRDLQCVLIPARERLAAISANTQQTRQLPADQDVTPIYERPLVIDGKRSRKPNVQRTTISDFFHPTPRLANKAVHHSNDQPIEIKSSDDERSASSQPHEALEPVSSGSMPTHEHSKPEGKPAEDTKRNANPNVSQRPRRSNARQSYVTELIDDSSEDEITASAPTLRRKSRNVKAANIESDFEDKDSLEEDEEAHSEQKSESEIEEEDSESDIGSDEGYGSGAKSKGHKQVSNGKPKVPKANTVRGTSKTGKQTGRSTAKDMLKLTGRNTGEPKGLNTDLPPLSSINDIFMDITAKALDRGLREVLEANPRPLRVATMCSGTESPLLALEMVQDALKSLGAPALNVEHLFSAEIVPYKQAYIERNFHPPIIFRDITELTSAVSEDVPTATTVYGSKVVIPGDVDILIAGTSCVDFSRLNKHRKDLDEDDGGESSKTWFGVLSYVKAFRPAIVILENVLHGPWDRMMECYREIDYEVGGILLDTKNYYLPQTRQRGYLVCFDKSKATDSGIKGAGKKWESLMSHFRRYASSSVADFMLPAEKVRITQQLALDDSSKEYDWAACEIRHIQYRQEERLGNARPLTFWSESGTMNVPENGFPSWYRKQPERVRDYMDISVLRKALLYDVRYKTRIWDVSQNVDMFKDSSQFGMAPCITPSGLFFASDAGRALTSEELLALQGLPLNKVSFTTESASEVQDLAGNAMSTTAVGPAILSALICGSSVLYKHRASSPAIEQDVHMTVPVSRKIANPQTRPVFSAKLEDDLGLDDLLVQAAESARRCLCEGSVGIARKPIQQCTDCGHTTCIKCGGNPSHNYQLILPKDSKRIDPVQFERKLRSCLPQCIAFNDASEITTPDRGYSEAFKAALGGTFTFSRLQRTHLWTAMYYTPSARLELQIDGTSALWRLFAIPDKQLPVNSQLRRLLEQPIAQAKCEDSLLATNWHCREPTSEAFPMQIEGCGTRIGSWLARLELPDYRDQQIWSRVRITVPERASTALGCNLNGLYQALPQCGTSSDSLYKKVDTEDPETPIYLLQNPTRTGDPKLDTFVFTTENERLDFGAERPIIASLNPEWTPWADFKSVTLKPAGVWKPLAAILREVDPQAVVHAPVSLSVGQLTLDCRQAELISKCNFVNTGDIDSAGPLEIDPKNDRFFAQHSHILELMRRELPITQWRELPSESLGCNCESCAPLKPALRWMLNQAQAIKPYEDPASAATYEQSIKQRPNPMLFQISHTNDRVSTIHFGLNIASLAHRAVARLPARQADRITWVLEQDIALASNFRFQPFALRSTEGQSTPEDVGMTCQLFPKQSQVLKWMQQQEMGKSFIIEEAEEAILPALGWRAEVRAETEVKVRGGICADHPGFGKTITSLALIHSHLSSDNDIVADLRARQTDQATRGLIPTQATLIVAPHTLVKQWAAEIKERLGYTKGVVTIGTLKELDKYIIASFEQAKIIIVNRTVLGHVDYAERLANFVAMPGPATNLGRAFSQWLAHACKEIPAHLAILRSEGLKGLQKHVKSRYAELIRSDDFRAVVPSRRLVGKDYVQSKSKPKTTANAALKDIPTGSIDRPLFEQFFFNRIIIDEFHQYTPREYASLKALKADKRWGLSGTPALTDFYDIAQIADLLNIPLRIGSDSTQTMAPRNVRALRKEMTDFERFDAMREVPSDCMHARIHEVAQGFLDAFVRQNVMDFDEMAYEDHLIPVGLDVDHQAAYTELSQQLASSEMNIRKAKKSKTSMCDKRFMAAVADVETAEEALSRDAAFFSRPSGKQGLQHMIDARQSEVNSILKDLKAACFAAQHEFKESNQPLDQMASTLLEERTLGDDEAIGHVQSILRSTANPAVATPSKSKSQSKKKGNSAEDGDGDEASAKESKDLKKARGLTAQVNALAKGLLTSIRSKRYIESVHSIRKTASKSSKCDSEACVGANGHDEQNVAVSGLCGHRICNDCHKVAKEHHRTQCAAEGCSAPQHDHHLLWSHMLKDADQTTSYGAKLDAALKLLQGIGAKREKAILFVQFKEQVDQVATALDKVDIAATVVESQYAGDQILRFCNNDDTVLVLNASDETAAGSNIQAANHVIFLSPLLRDNQYTYDATMAQAIGRVRRHGQTRPIHVYRIFALHTIDVDILEHREHRDNALVEPGAPTVQPPTAAMELDQHDPPQKDRVQLVKEKGKFSLRPRPWLYLCGADNDEHDMADVKGRNRVAGWEDFSSQVKFSRAFAGDD